MEISLHCLAPFLAMVSQDDIAANLAHTVVAQPSRHVQKYSDNFF